jgi:translation initiation factor 2B subunit (eIF-2B alpha/beta/delta family)
MPSYISKWQVRKIKELSDQPDSSRGGISTTIGIIVLAILIGCAAGGGYVYVQLLGALEKVTIANAASEKLSETVKTQEAQLKEAQAAKSSLDTAVKEVQEQLRQLQVSRQDAEQALKDQLAQAQAAREAAENALAEAKKATPQ